MDELYLIGYCKLINFHARNMFYLFKVLFAFCIGYTPRARLLSDLATECCRHKDAKSHLRCVINQHII